MYNVYSLVVREMFGNFPVKASLFYLKDNKIREYVPDNELITTFIDRMSTLIRSIHVESFPACPGPGLRYCDYGSLCET